MHVRIITRVENMPVPLAVCCIAREICTVSGYLATGVGVGSSASIYTTNTFYFSSRKPVFLSNRNVLVSTQPLDRRYPHNPRGWLSSGVRKNHALVASRSLPHDNGGRESSEYKLPGSPLQQYRYSMQHPKHNTCVAHNWLRIDTTASWTVFRSAPSSSNLQQLVSVELHPVGVGLFMYVTLPHWPSSLTHIFQVFWRQPLL